MTVHVKQNKIELEELIDTLREEWFHSGNRLALSKIGNDLLGYGLTPEQAYDIISRVFSTACSEYGD